MFLVNHIQTLKEIIIMNNYTKLNENQLKAVNGGGYTYYGNGLYVDVKNGKSYVNWGQTWQEGAARAGKAYANGFGKILGGIGGR